MIDEFEELFLPMKVYVYVTNHCHYSCDYCFLKEQELLNTLHMSTDTLANVLSYLEEYQVSLVAICGGDPFVYPHLIDFVQKLSEHRNYPMIATNAVDVTYEYLKKLKKVGIRYLQIGIDSISEDKNENFKENGHVAKVEKSITYLKNLGIKYGIASCINNKNVSFLEDIVDYSKKIGAESLKISLYNGDNPRYQLTDSQVNNLEVLIRKINSTEIFVRYSKMEETLNHKSPFPSIRIYPNGDVTIDSTEVTIGNINISNPAQLYVDYLKEQR